MLNKSHLDKPSGAGTVTDVTGTAPIVSSGGATPAISIPAATTLVPGHATITQITKLDGIEAGATKYPDTGEQAFLDADHTKLDGIEASAVALPTIKADADIASAISLKHTQGSDTALGAVGTKDPPIDADKALYRDSVASDALVTSTWTQIKAFLKTYFDTPYELDVNGDIMPKVFGLFEFDIDGDLRPAIDGVADQYYELDGSNDIMPKAA